MSILKNNLNALQQRYPDLYQKVHNHKPTGRYVVKKSNNNVPFPNIYDTKTGQFVYGLQNPPISTEQYIASKNIKLPKLNIFLGGGLYYACLAMQKIHKESMGMSIILEKDLDLFVSVLPHVDISDLIKHPLYFLFVDTPVDIFTTNVTTIFKNSSAKMFLKSINFIEEPYLYINEKEYYLNCVKSIKVAVYETILFYGNDPLDSLIGINHTFKNIREIIDYPGVNQLKDSFKGKPGIVVATGPSLSKNIDLLHGIENKAVICAVDASMKVMKEANLKPHFVTCLERVTATTRLFDNINKEDTENVFLAATPVVHPETYANWPGERIVVYRQFATFKWLNIEKGILEIGASSGNMAFKLLEYLGCDPIILIGQDLSYAPDGQTHAKGATYGENQKTNTAEGLIKVKGNYQPEVLTNKVWHTFLQHYNQDALNSPAKIINATEGGAFIQNTDIMTLKEAIDTYIQDDINTIDTIKNRLVKPTDQERHELMVNTRQLVEHGLEFCHHANDVFQQIVNLCDKFYGEILKDSGPDKYTLEQGTGYISQIEELSKILNSDDFFQILMHYVQAYVIKINIDVNEIKSKAANIYEEHLQITILSHKLFTVLKGLNEKMITLLEELNTELKED